MILLPTLIIRRLARFLERRRHACQLELKERQSGRAEPKVGAARNVTGTA
jgi:hypothetical protein